MKRLLSRSLDFVVVFALVLSASCSAFTPDETGTQTALPRATNETTAVDTSETPQPAASETPASTETPLTLRVWLPPQFDPYNGTPGGELLRLRLAEFTARHPGMRLDVRIKAVDGPGGLLDGLSAVISAAPGAAPDLVALSRPLLEAAALKGLLYPYDGLSQAAETLDWYPYALQLGDLQGSTFGLPFAGDALVLMYDASIGKPPALVDSILQAPELAAFPLTDPQALMTLSLYMASDGPIQDEQGRPVLDAAQLERVLVFYEGAARVGAFLPQIETPEQALEAFNVGRVNYAVVWASGVLGSSELRENTALATLPNFDGSVESLATGWVWALSSNPTGRQRIAVELAEFLTDPEFLQDWALSAGYLPVQAAGLEGYASSPYLSAVKQVCESAFLLPSTDLLTSLAPALHQASLDVLSGQLDARTAAEKAAAGLR